jgi:hypothetical protein
MRRTTVGGSTCAALCALLAGCDGTSSVAVSETGSSDHPSAKPLHVCVPKPLPYPPPEPALSFTIDGKTGNRHLVTGTHGVTVHFTMTQRPGAEVTRLRFAVMPENGAMPGSEVRVFPAVRETWGPGDHVTTLKWDGTDDHGRAVRPGAYRIEAQVTGTVPQTVTCKDGSGQGVELHKGTTDEGLPVFVRVPARTVVD